MWGGGGLAGLGSWSIYLQFAQHHVPDKPSDDSLHPVLLRLQNSAKAGAGCASSSATTVLQTRSGDWRRRIQRGGVSGVQSNGTNCKGIIVDGESVLVSSANWSGTGAAQPQRFDRVRPRLPATSAARSSTTGSRGPDRRLPTMRPC